MMNAVFSPQITTQLYLLPDSSFTLKLNLDIPFSHIFLGGIIQGNGEIKT